MRYRGHKHCENNFAQKLSIVWFLFKEMGEAKNVKRHKSSAIYFSRYCHCQMANAIPRSVICRNDRAPCSGWPGHTHSAQPAQLWSNGSRMHARRIQAQALNLLNPTGHVMHQQFNIQQLYVLPTLYLCVLYLSENKQRLVPLTA